jgi:uncharacterized protein (DUF1778 family)
MGKNISERIDMRITADQKKLIQIAASLDGCNTVSSFIIRTVINKSIKVIEKNYRVLKSLKDKEIFIEALTNPPAPNKKLKKM